MDNFIKHKKLVLVISAVSALLFSSIYYYINYYDFLSNQDAVEIYKKDSERGLKIINYKIRTKRTLEKKEAAQSAVELFYLSLEVDIGLAYPLIKLLSPPTASMKLKSYFFMSFKNKLSQLAKTVNIETLYDVLKNELSLQGVSSDHEVIVEKAFMHAFSEATLSEEATQRLINEFVNKEENKNNNLDINDPKKKDSDIKLFYYYRFSINLLRKNADYQQAIMNSAKAYSLARKHKELQNDTGLILETAKVYRDRGKYNKALELIEPLMKQFKPEEKPLIYYHKSIILTLQEKYKDALELAENTEEIAKNNQIVLALLQHNIARTYMRMEKKRARALKYYNLSIKNSGENINHFLLPLFDKFFFLFTYNKIDEALETIKPYIVSKDSVVKNKELALYCDVLDKAYAFLNSKEINKMNELSDSIEKISKTFGPYNFYFAASSHGLQQYKNRNP